MNKEIEIKQRLMFLIKIVFRFDFFVVLVKYEKRSNVIKYAKYANM